MCALCWVAVTPILGYMGPPGYSLHTPWGECGIYGGDARQRNGKEWACQLGMLFRNTKRSGTNSDVIHQEHELGPVSETPQRLSHFFLQRLWQWTCLAPQFLDVPLETVSSHNLWGLKNPGIGCGRSQSVEQWSHEHVLYECSTSLSLVLLTSTQFPRLSSGTWFLTPMDSAWH